MERKVTALKAQKRNPGRVNVYLDGEFAFGLAHIVAAWLQVGQELSEEKIAALLAEDEVEDAFQKALRFFKSRMRAEAEVQQYLVKQGIQPGVISNVLERLRKSGLVDDKRFVQAWVENRSAFHPRSRRALAYELRRLGVDRDTIDPVLDQVEEAELAYQAARNQQRKLRDLDWPEFREKMLAFLARRGFNYETSAETISRLWEEQKDNQ